MKTIPENIPWSAEEIAKALATVGNPRLIHYIGDLRRVGVQSFITFLEYKHFIPDTSANEDYTLSVVEWEKMKWVVVSIPYDRKGDAETEMKLLGLRAANGFPHAIYPYGTTNVVVIGSVRRGGPGLKKLPPGRTVLFPIYNTDRCFTLENIDGHFAFDNDSMMYRVARQAEQEAVGVVIAAHKAAFDAGKYSK